MGKTKETETTEVGGIVGKKLKAYLDRIMKLEEEKSGLTKDVNEVYAEAKGNGFDTKAMRAVLKKMKMEEHDRKELDEIVDLYSQAVGI